MATCQHIHCSLGQRCLTEWQTGRPRCVTCSTMPCSDHHRRNMEVCGSNNRTYHSWCHMIKDSCATGYVIETQSSGHCPAEDQGELMANTVLGGKHS
ncbi:hypothetical protein J6590_002782 [Homalodisca vitripennis]|nr:hypothetical protein J6590_002782 [Homalodisca vitripennis]